MKEILKNILIIGVTILITLLVLGCEDKLVQPEWDNYSGVYKSLKYNEWAKDYFTNEMFWLETELEAEMTVYHEGGQLVGTVIINGNKIAVSGFVETYDNLARMRLDGNGLLIDAWRKSNDVWFYGTWIYNNKAECFRFYLYQKLHQQGSIYIGE